MTLLIVMLGVEERPRLLVDSLSDQETLRLLDWLASSSAREELQTLAAALLAELRNEPEEAA
jgi:cytochrome c-type biogenesis protein CcmH/NrfG